jgi:hypothetical protein
VRIGQPGEAVRVGLLVTAEGGLAGVTGSMGVSEEELVRQFCSEDPLERACAYRYIGEYFGWDNLYQYPLIGLSRAEVRKRYEDHLRRSS